MDYPNKIITITKSFEFKFKEKGSLFIGQAFPINSTEESEKILGSIRKKYYDATHNCYAYKLLINDTKYSDDGEPNGTAGLRILNAINHFELINVLVIVTRYFGGTKLGVGPLGKAYYNSALGVLKEAELIKKENYSRIQIQFNYNLISHVHHFLNQFKAINIQNIFKEIPQIECLVKPEFVNTLTSELNTVSKGEIKLKLFEECIYK